MSSRSYLTLWNDVQKSLEFLLSDDVTTITTERFQDLSHAFNRIAVLYLRYIRIVKKLSKCYEQITQPQKLLTLQKILEAVIGRILELKAELVKIENRDFHFMNNLLLDFRMTPEDLELPIPKWHLLPEEKEYQLLSQKILKDYFTDETFMENNIINSTDDAVILIQKHERARQNRKILLNIILEKKNDDKICSSMDDDKAAFLIQKNWKTYNTMKSDKNKLIMERRLLGMISSNISLNLKESYQYHLEKNQKLLYEIQEENLEKYEKALVTVKEQLRLCESDNMKEKLEDDIRKWYLSYRDKHNDFPDFPSEEEGGSNKIFYTQAIDENMKEAAQYEKVKKKEVKKEIKIIQKKLLNTSESFLTSASNCIPIVNEGCNDYNVLWKDRNETNNTLKIYENLIRQQKLLEMKDEIRIEVDQIMRKELEVLKEALAKDKGMKRKKRKGKGRKRKKKLKIKKDLTADRSLESLYKELLENGIIIKCVPTILGDFLGDYNFVGASLSRQTVESIWHHSADIKHIIIAYCILPLSNSAIHMLAPLIKSILFFGPPGVGKKVLVNAICSATNAVIFDLSPENIVNKYPGKAGLKMLMHLVEKVGKIFQPSVIIINNAEKSFMKKVPKTDKSDPKRLKKALIKFIKSIKPSDRILLCGVSNAPFNASDMKGLNATYQKMIYVPPPEFGSRQIIWKNFILQTKGEMTSQLHLSTLSKISDGYTGNQIKLVVQEILTSRRIGMLKEIPLSEIEFIDALSQYIPLYKSQIEAYKNWFNKTSLAKKRKKMLASSEEKTKK